MKRNNQSKLYYISDGWYICKKCGEKFKDSFSKGWHTRKCFSKEDIERFEKEYVDYIDRKDCYYMNDNGEYVCKGCNKKYEDEFSIKHHVRLCKGFMSEEEYKSFCEELSNKCKISCMEKYGDPNYNNPEKREKTCLEKYGVKYSGQSREVILKRQNTEREKYNGILFVQTEIFKDKCKETNNKTKGFDWPMQSKLIQNKSKETCLNKYGVEYSFQSENNKEKSKRTLLAKYGVDNAFKSDEIKEKIKNYNKLKYGVDYYVQSDDFKNKSINTCMNNYGVEYYGQSEESQKNRRSQYSYDNLKFDSRPELAFYIEYKNLVKRNFEKYITYNYKGIEKRAYPDFIMDENLIEIKGSHFLKEDGSWQNPFNHSLDELMESKHKGLIENNVIIIYDFELEELVKKHKNIIDKCKKEEEL